MATRALSPSSDGATACDVAHAARSAVPNAKRMALSAGASTTQPASANTRFTVTTLDEPALRGAIAVPKAAAGRSRSGGLPAPALAAPTPAAASVSDGGARVPFMAQTQLAPADGLPVAFSKVRDAARYAGQDNAPCMPVFPDQDDIACRREGNDRHPVCQFHDMIGRHDMSVLAFTPVGAQAHELVAHDLFGGEGRPWFYRHFVRPMRASLATSNTQGQA